MLNHAKPSIWSTRLQERTLWTEVSQVRLGGGSKVADLRGIHSAERQLQQSEAWRAKVDAGGPGRTTSKDDMTDMTDIDVVCTSVSWHLVDLVVRLKKKKKQWWRWGIQICCKKCWTAGHVSTEVGHLRSLAGFILTLGAFRVMNSVTQNLARTTSQPLPFWICWELSSYFPLFHPVLSSAFSGLWNQRPKTVEELLPRCRRSPQLSFCRGMAQCGPRGTHSATGGAWWLNVSNEPGAVTWAAMSSVSELVTWNTLEVTRRLLKRRQESQ